MILILMYVNQLTAIAATGPSTGGCVLRGITGSTFSALPLPLGIYCRSETYNNCVASVSRYKG